MLNSSLPSATATAAAAAAAAGGVTTAATANPFLWNLDEHTPPPQPPASILTNTQPQPQQKHLPNYTNAPTSQLPFNFYARVSNQHFGGHSATIRERNFELYRRSEPFAYEQQQQQFERRLQGTEHKRDRSNGSNSKSNKNNVHAHVDDNNTESILLSNDSDDDDDVENENEVSSLKMTDYNNAVAQFLSLGSANSEQAKLTSNKQDEVKSADACAAAAEMMEDKEAAVKRQSDEDKKCQQQATMNNKCNNEDVMPTNAPMSITLPCAENESASIKNVARSENVAQHAAQAALE